MTATPLRFIGIAVETDRLDPQSRRREPLETPLAVLNVAAGSTIRRVELTHADVARLLEQAAAANRRLIESTP